jgi:sialic acid synthase SpsE/mannose-6-phosphate isomerase-like protein (cupin superfamily)
MSAPFDFNGLFVCDMANNHQGEVEHGLKIIDQIGDALNQRGVKGAIKFQFRHIDTFIHPDFTDIPNIKHIPRFIETRLPDEDYAVMTQRIRDKGLVSIATPFDEDSLALLQKLEIEIIKVASCSATDWPLLAEIVKYNKPVIISTAGASLDDIDKIVFFMADKKVDFALMHCVGIYPTPVNKLALNQIKVLRHRYPEVTVGFSTHEEPDYYQAIRVAYALGARIFERHVDVKAQGKSMNAYSSDADQIGNWVDAYLETVAACGPEKRPPADRDEVASLNTLKRGAYAKGDIAQGQELGRKDVFFAMPLQEGQLTSGHFVRGMAADRDYLAKQPLSEELAEFEASDEQYIDKIIRQIRGILNEANVHVGPEFNIELSHHYGLHRFREFGAVIIDCVNRGYCKKLLVQLPRQKHPYHHHRIKEETFCILHGQAEIEINGERKRYRPGDMVVVEPGQWHKFQTSEGVIFEEVSTTHHNDDSVYDDPAIAKKQREDRKTVVKNWIRDRD